MAKAFLFLARTAEPTTLTKYISHAVFFPWLQTSLLPLFLAIFLFPTYPSSMVILSTPITAINENTGTTTAPTPALDPHVKSLSIIYAHTGPVSSLALAGEFVLSASHSQEITVWQQPGLHPLTRFGQGDGSVKALIASGNRVFTAHQDRRIRVWKIYRRPECAFCLVATLPTARDYLVKLIRHNSFIQTRRNHRRLWIEHDDTISCLAVCNGIIYSGSWDRTLKLWTATDLKCLESIRAHDDAINGLVVHKGVICSASADGKIRIWAKGKITHCLKATLVSRKEVSWNAVIFCDDGRVVYGGGSDGFVMGWESQGARQLCRVRAHEMAVLCLCSTAEFVCSGSADKSIGLWRREGDGVLKKFGVIRGHEGPVKCLQASSWSYVGQGFRLYSGSVDKSFRVWWVPKVFGEEEEGKKLEVMEERMAKSKMGWWW